MVTAKTSAAASASLYDRLGRRLRRQVVRPALVRLLPRRSTSDIPPDFLIVGLQKCGTYWLTNLLDLHPEISCFPTEPSGTKRIMEGHFFDWLMIRDSDPALFREKMWQIHDGHFWDLVAKTSGMPRGVALEQYCQRYNAFVMRQRRPGTRLVGEKTPEYVFALPLIDELYPGIRKVCILREPCDRVASYHHHQLRKGYVPADTPLRDTEVSDYVLRMEREYRDLLESDGSLHLLSYELLHQNPEVTLDGLLAYLGADREPVTVRRVLQGATFERLAGRGAESDDPSSHFRKGTVGEGHLELDHEQQALVHSRMDLLTRRMVEKSSLDLTSHSGAACRSASASGVVPRRADEARGRGALDETDGTGTIG